MIEGRSRSVKEQVALCQTDGQDCYSNYDHSYAGWLFSVDECGPRAGHCFARCGAHGEIASLTLMHESGEFANPKIRVFKMFYWSAGKKVEAWLTEPMRPGHYPLLVVLHGGWPWDMRHLHRVTTVIGVNVFPSFSYYEDFSSKIVTITPAYRGYGKSQGSVQGMFGDTLDADNAMKAAFSLHHVKPNDTYVWGVSMGGGIALMLASEQKGIRAVVADSPFCTEPG